MMNPSDCLMHRLFGTTPLNAFERANQFFIDKPVEPNATILNDSLYCINDTYLETIYPGHVARHFVLFLTILCSAISVVTGGLFLFTLFRLIGLWFGWKTAETFGDVAGFYFDVVVTFLFFCLSIAIAVTFISPNSVFYLTRLPQRLNRKTQKIYAIRSSGMWRQEVWEIDWHDPKNYFCLTYMHSPRGKNWSDEKWESMGKLKGIGPRFYIPVCYQLDDKGIIQRGVCLGNGAFDLQEAYRNWEYYRRYMAEGPQNLRLPHLFWRADERNSLIEMFAVCKGRSTVGVVALLELLTLPITLLIHLPCRVLSLWTSREAKWPDEVEAACQIEPDDPWARPLPNQPIGWANNEDRHKKDWGWLSSAERYAPEKLEQWRSLYEPAQQWAEQRYPTDETV